MGTGDGSALADLTPLPATTVAYEEWTATIPQALDTLRPLGVALVQCVGADDNTVSVRTRPGLPFGDHAFDLVLNRHEAFDAGEVYRITGPQGLFVTAQVGSDETTSVRALLGLAGQEPIWDLAEARRQLLAAGWAALAGGEERPATRFTDVGALVAYCRSTPWAFTDIDATDAETWRHLLRSRLRELHDRSRSGLCAPSVTGSGRAQSTRSTILSDQVRIIATAPPRSKKIVSDNHREVPRK